MARPRLHVCVTCQAGRELADGETPPGRLLHDAVAALGAGDVDLATVECLAACENGCNAAISMPGKWTYLLGHLDPALADDVLTYTRAYAASKTGTVMPSKRPESLRWMILGRVPPPLPLPLWKGVGEGFPDAEST
jgi:predicted metal-binding protein